MTRLERIAVAMKLTPGPDPLLVTVNVRADRWDLQGCEGGPAPLPGTNRQMSFKEAISAAERELCIPPIG